MTGPRGVSATTVTVKSKQSAIPCGIYKKGIQVLNNSTVDTVWVGNTSAVKTGVGVPLAPLSACALSEDSNVWLILDNAAVGNVDVILGGILDTITGPSIFTGDVDANIVGPVTVTGTVDIGAGTVNATIVGPVDINTAQVNVINEPFVKPKIEITPLVSGSVTTSFALANLSAYSSLIIICEFAAATAVQTSDAYFQGTLTRGTGPGIPIDDGTYYLQPYYFPSGGSIGDKTKTILPLNGADHLFVNAFQAGTTSPVFTFSVYGTTQDLPKSHNTIYQTEFDNGISLLTENIIVTTGTLQIPIPISSEAITLYLHNSATSSAQAQIVRLFDNITGGQIQVWTIPAGWDAQQPGRISTWGVSPNPVTYGIDPVQPGYRQFPHSMIPMYLQFSALTAGNTNTLTLEIHRNNFVGVGG